jgi:hypothetical protein
MIGGSWGRRQFQVMTQILIPWGILIDFQLER